MLAYIKVINSLLRNRMGLRSSSPGISMWFTEVVQKWGQSLNTAWEREHCCDIAVGIVTNLRGNADTRMISIPVQLSSVGFTQQTN